jgi:serine/threonine protein kinase
MLLSCAKWPCADLSRVYEWKVDTALPKPGCSEVGLQHDDISKVVKTITDMGVIRDAQHEVTLHSLVNDHPNVVRLFPELCVVQPTIIRVVTERGYCDMLTLTNNRLEHTERLDVMAVLPALVSAVEYLHSRRIAHMDIKPENIVLGIDWHPKLIDFGGARQLAEDGTCRYPSICTPEYAAPEVNAMQPRYGKRTREMLGNQSMIDGRAADLWSIGVTAIFFALPIEIAVFHPDHPVPHWRDYAAGTLSDTEAESRWHGALAVVDNEPQSMCHIFETLEHVCPPGLTPLIKWCLSFDPSKRPLIGDLIDYVEFYASQGTLKPAYSSCS